MKPNISRALRVDQYMYHTYEMHFVLRVLKLFFRPRVFSRALGCNCGVHRGAACAQRRKFKLQPGSVASSLGVQSSRELAVCRAIAFHDA